MTIPPTRPADDEPSVTHRSGRSTCRLGRRSGRSARPSGRRTLGAALCLLLLGAAATLGCRTDASGPPFTVAQEPGPGRARVYIYRSDSRGSRSSIRVTLNGRDLGRFQNGQYETLEVSPGPMRLRASMRGMGWVNWGWNDFSFRVRHGETAFIELSVRLVGEMEPVQRGPRDAEIAGRPTGQASDNVFILQRPEFEALSRLRVSNRIPQEQ